MAYQPYFVPQYNPYYQQIPQPQQQPQVPLQSNLYGKIVDSIELVRIQDVPLGQTGIYPKADGSEIFVKSWNTDGTTSISQYQKINTDEDIVKTNILNDIYNSIKIMNDKIDALSSSNSTQRKNKKEGEVINHE